MTFKSPSLDEYDDSCLLIHKRVSGSCVVVFGASCMEFTKRVLMLHALHLTWLLDLQSWPPSHFFMDNSTSQFYNLLLPKQDLESKCNKL